MNLSMPVAVRWQRADLVPNLVPNLVPSSPTAPANQKIQQSARQFESQMLASLLTSLETSFGSVPGSEESGTGEQYHAMATQSLASAWAAAGGIGIARILTRALAKTSATMALPPDAGNPCSSFSAECR